MTPNQYGFHPGRATIDATDAVLGVVADAANGMAQDRHLYLLVALNVRNAFNTAPWHLIDMMVVGFDVPLYIRKMIRSYLSERRILVPGGGALCRKDMTCGILQGRSLDQPYGTYFIATSYSRNSRRGPSL